MRNKQPLSITANTATVNQTPHPLYAPRSFIYNRYSGQGRDPDELMPIYCYLISYYRQQAKVVQLLRKALLPGVADAKPLYNKGQVTIQNDGEENPSEVEQTQ